MVFMLDDEIGFPDPRQGDEDGFFAVGGDLSVDRLLLAYSYGIFPWYSFRAEDTHPSLIDPATGRPYIQWWCPMRRFVIIPREVHVSHSMRPMLHRLDRGELRVTFNEAFDDVIAQCSATRWEVEGAWLGKEMIEAYTALNEMGFAASVEVWDDTCDPPRLIGGLYGVTLGKAFIGESMFSLAPSASKLALIKLAQSLDAVGCTMIDCQFETPHLRSMGGRYISYDEYLELIK